MKIYTTLPNGTKIIDSHFLLNAYCNGMFPMADGVNGTIHWFSPERRGIIPLDRLVISRSLRQTMRKNVLTVRVNSNFEGTIRACADRDDVWISETIVQSYLQLYRIGFAHSVECWYEDALVGGLYGVAIGGAFFGESMFSRMDDASKVALVSLVHRLNERQFTLLDTQYVNAHLATMGCVEITKQEYKRRLASALSLQRDFR